MNNQFITWAMFLDFATFTTLVFVFVNFTKELPLISKIPTKYWSAIVAFALMLVVNLHNATFTGWDVFLYVFNAILISLTANGVADFNKKTVVSTEIKS